VLSDAHASEVIATVARLEELSSARKLMDLLRGTAQSAQSGRAA
jgi:hypothetical protein